MSCTHSDKDGNLMFLAKQRSTRGGNKVSKYQVSAITVASYKPFVKSTQKAKRHNTKVSIQKYYVCKLNKEFHLLCLSWYHD
jgi:hypothetical protein